MEKEQSSSNFYMLTAQILNDKNLNHAEKLTMAILNGLSNEDGKCWPSNEWLCEKICVKENAMRVILQNLEKNNYIRREIHSSVKDPFKKYRIIYVQNNFKLCLRVLENEGSDPSKTRGIIDKTSSLIDKKERKESSLKRAKEKSASPSLPLFESFYKDQFEGKIKISKEQRDRLLEKYGGMESLIDTYAEKLYRWSFDNPALFKKKTRHDMTIENWIDKDLSKKENATQGKSSGFSGLSEAQQKNWNQNLELVNELKVECPQKASGLHFYYKHYILKDKNNPHFDVSALIDHKDFCRLLEKHLGLKILNVRFPNG